MSSEEEILAIRYGRVFFNDVDILKRHNEVIDDKGSVLFGKIGKRVGLSRTNRMNAVIKEKGGAKMLLVGPKQGGRRFFAVNVVRIFITPPNSKKERIPQYYKELGFFGSIKTWFEINKMVPQEILKGEYATLSGREFLDSLDSSISGTFVIRKIS